MSKKYKVLAFISAIVLIPSLNLVNANASSGDDDSDRKSCSGSYETSSSQSKTKFKLVKYEAKKYSDKSDDSDDNSCSDDGKENAGNSGASEQKPSTPTAVVVANCSTTVTLSWALSTSNGVPATDFYRIRYSTNGGTTWTAFPTQPTQSPFTLNTLTSGLTYIFQVSAHNVNGWGNWSGSSTSCLVSAQSGTSFTFSIDGLNNIPGVGIDYSSDGLALTETFIATVTGAQSGSLVKGKFDHDLYISLPAGINYTFSVNGTPITSSGYTFFPVASAMGGNNPVTIGTNGWFYDFAQTYAFDIVSGSSIAIVILP